MKKIVTVILILIAIRLIYFNFRSVDQKQSVPSIKQPVRIENIINKNPENVSLNKIKQTQNHLSQFCIVPPPSLNVAHENALKELGELVIEQTDILNLEIKLDNGQTRRIQKIVEDDEKTYVKFFKLDIDGLPELVEQVEFTSEEDLDQFTSQGDESSREEFKTQITGDGSRISLLSINGKITELEIHTDQNIIKCQHNKCNCQ